MVEGGVLGVFAGQFQQRAELLDGRPQFRIGLVNLTGTSGPRAVLGARLALLRGQVTECRGEGRDRDLAVLIVARRNVADTRARLPDLVHDLIHRPVDAPPRPLDQVDRIDSVLTDVLRADARLRLHELDGGLGVVEVATLPAGRRPLPINRRDDHGRVDRAQVGVLHAGVAQPLLGAFLETQVGLAVPLTPRDVIHADLDGVVQGARGLNHGIDQRRPDGQLRLDVPLHTLDRGEGLGQFGCVGLGPPADADDRAIDRCPTEGRVLRLLETLLRLVPDGHRRSVKLRVLDVPLHRLRDGLAGLEQGLLLAGAVDHAPHRDVSEDIRVDAGDVLEAGLGPTPAP